MRNRIQVLLLSVCALCALGGSAGAASAPWLDADWERRVPFEADPLLIEDMTFDDMTLLLQLSAADHALVFAHADSTGADLALTTSDGQTLVDFELVHYDPVAQTAEIWFEAPGFSDTANQFFLYYDNPTPPLTGPAADAWTADHLAVYHFEQDPSLGALLDSGPGAGHAVTAVAPSPVGPGWTSADRVAAAVGNGWRFDGVDLMVYTENVASADSSFTIATWFANDPAADKGALAFNGPEGSWGVSFQRSGTQPLADAYTLHGNLAWVPEILDDDLHHYAWTLDAEADTIRFYLDGVESTPWLRYVDPGQPDVVFSGAELAGRVGIASPYVYNPFDLADGIVDEYRIVEGVRSPEWIRTEYNNQSTPLAFFSTGGEERYEEQATGIGMLAGSGALQSLSVWPNPFRGVAQIEVGTSLPRVTLQVFDLKGRLVRTLHRPRESGSDALRYLWDGRDDRGTRVSTGTYLVRAHGGGGMVSGKLTFVR